MLLFRQPYILFRLQTTCHSNNELITLGACLFGLEGEKLLEFVREQEEKEEKRRQLKEEKEEKRREDEREEKHQGRT